MNKIKNAVTFIGFALYMKNEQRKANRKEKWNDGA